MPPQQETFTETGPSLSVGEGPVFYRLNCSTYNSGTISYFFGYDTLTPPRHILMLLTGTWSGQVDVQFSTDKITWADVPGESYTANASRYIRG